MRPYRAELELCAPMGDAPASAPGGVGTLNTYSPQAGGKSQRDEASSDYGFSTRSAQGNALGKSNGFSLQMQTGAAEGTSDNPASRQIRKLAHRIRSWLQSSLVKKKSPGRSPGL